MRASPRVLFIFLDGVGIGSSDPSLNPFLAARLPTLRGLLAGGIPTLDDGGVFVPEDGEALVTPLEARMGMEGLPQSGTGQTALLTGENAAILYGRHFGPWVPVPLRPLMMDKNLLSKAQERGFRCAFANAYPAQYLQVAWTKRPAGPPLAAQGAGLLTRTEVELAKGKALSSEIVNTAWRNRLGLTHVPEISPTEAGRTLAAIAAKVDLTLFAHYSTDTAGHQGSMEPAVDALQRVDSFLGGLIPALEPGTLLVLASDHGNIEDVSRGHTTNPAFGLFFGPGVRQMISDASSITDIPSIILRHLDSEA